MIPYCFVKELLRFVLTVVGHISILAASCPVAAGQELNQSDLLQSVNTVRSVLHLPSSAGGGERKDKPLLRLGSSGQDSITDSTCLLLSGTLSRCCLLLVLQQWLGEVKDKSSVFSTLEEELAKAKAVGEQLFRLRQERSIDLERYQEKGSQLWDRWQRVCAQIETR